MEFFLKKTKGSITVLVALIMMPTVFFTSFLVDLARLKLYGNQAVMLADNYGEAALTYYDNALKELYGLFAMTQDAEALEQLAELDAYVKSSFNPDDSTVSWEHIKEFTKVSYEGFMPYSSAEVELSYTPVENANLSNYDVLATQIGDFMKFRIAQQYLDGENNMINAVSKILNMQEDSKAMTQKMEYDESASEMFDKMKTFYESYKVFLTYPEYIEGVNDQYILMKNAFTQLENSESYKTYIEYEKNKEEIEKAVKHKEEIEKYEEALKKAEEEKSKKETTETEGEIEEEETVQLPEKPADLTEAEKQLLALKDKYDNDSNARKDKLQAKLDGAISALKLATTTGEITCDNYETKLSSLGKAAKKVSDAAGTLASQRNSLETVITSGNVSKDITEGMTEDLIDIDNVTGYDKSTGSSDFQYIEHYEGSYNYINTNDTPVNTTYSTQMDDMLTAATNYKNALFDDTKTKPEWPEALDETAWKDVFDVKEYKELYEELKGCFENPITDAEEKANNSKKIAEEKQKEAEEALSGDEETSARNVPSCLGYESKDAGGKFSLLGGASGLTKILSINDFKNAINDLILKFYVVSYDFGMFSSRVTNLEDDSPLEDITDADTGAVVSETKESDEVETSLTGYEMSRKLNYLYQAELEYLLGGSDTSKKNLNEVRNKICAFRGVMNFVSTYTIPEIHNAITSISSTASAVNPILGLVVNGVLRASVATIETAADWTALKKGESVNLYKNKWDDLQSADTILAVIGDKGKSEVVEEKENIGLDYEQYLFIMLLFMTSKDEIDKRTSNLIEMNVNAALKNVGETGELTGDLPFRMKDAHTAVNATCTVKLGFVVMPENFLKAVASDESYGRYKEWDAEGYQFTVTRGY